MAGNRAADLGIRLDGSSLVGRARLHESVRAGARKRTVLATVAGNVRVTEVGKEYDTHHIVLAFGSTPFPVLEGQSIGSSRLASMQTGDRISRVSIPSRAPQRRAAGYNNLSLTIKRVLEDHHGNPVRGVASNYMCDLQIGDKVEVIGPFGASFLMPNHPKSHIVMICTGTGSAPMRAMTEWRRRLRASEKFEGGKLLLFFGARSKEELPYFGPLKSCRRISSTSIRVQPHTRPAEALRPGRHARSSSGHRAPLVQSGRLLLCVRVESDGGRRRACATRHRGKGGSRVGDRCVRPEARRPLHLETY
jgi:benzoyl-CoA oxygenase/reductase BoxA protein